MREPTEPGVPFITHALATPSIWAKIKRRMKAIAAATLELIFFD
jgi:hypothetical protein